MNHADLIARLIEALAWPLVATVALIVLRRELRKLLSSLRRVSYRDFSAEFERIEEASLRIVDTAPPVQLPLPAPKSADEMLEALLEVSPRAAVVEAFRSVEQTLRDAAERRGLAEQQRRSVIHVARDLARRVDISEDVLGMFDEMRRIRNELVHSEEDVSARDARRFLGYARVIGTHFSRL